MKRPFLSILCFGCIALSGLAYAMSDSQSSWNGIYEVTKENGMIIPLKDGEICAPPFTLDGEACIEKYESVDRLALFQSSDTEMLFAVDAVFFNGHSCSIGGTAIKTNTSWVYASMNELDDTSNTYDDCKLTFSKDKDGLLLQTAVDAPCQMYCGMRGSLDGLHFPHTDKLKQSVDANRVKCLGLFEDAKDCAQYDTKKGSQE